MRTKVTGCIPLMEDAEFRTETKTRRQIVRI